MTNAELPLFPDDAGRPPGKPTPAADSPHRPPPLSPPAADSASEPPPAEPPPSATPAAPCPSPSPADELAEGRRRRDQALKLQRSMLCTLVATREMLRRLLDFGVANVDDLAHLPVPAGKKPNYHGTVVMRMNKLGITEEIDYGPSRRRVAHARRIQTLGLVNRGEAERLLSQVEAEINRRAAPGSG